MTARDILIQWLRSHGYDGLYDGEGCGCHVNDFAPCDSPDINRCKPGHQAKRLPKGCAYWIIPGKRKT